METLKGRITVLQTPKGTCSHCPYRISVKEGKYSERVCTLRVYEARGKDGVAAALSAQRGIPTDCNYLNFGSEE